MTIEFYEEKNGFGEYQAIGTVKGDRLSDGTRVYRFEELHGLEGILREAQVMYRRLGEAHLAKHGDVGTCVLGNGIYVAVKPPKARRAFQMRIAGTVGQSESASYGCKDAVLAYLKSVGVEAWYECGRMD